MSKQQAVSFTFRIPADIDLVFKSRVGERDRSKFLVQALRQALGIAEESQLTEPNTDLMARITELSHRLEVFKTEQDKILQRLAKIEEVDPVPSQTKQDFVVQSLANTESVNSTTIDKAKSVLQKQAESKTDSMEAVQPELKTELILLAEGAKDDENQTGVQPFLDLNLDGFKPEGEIVSSSELLSALRQEDPKRKWNSSLLVSYREGHKVNTWHTVGNCMFIYAKDQGRKKIGAGREQHLWRMKKAQN
jgi:hypothetical protein